MEHVEEAMTAEYLTSLLKTPVDSVKILTGSNPGDNYMCVVYSLEVVLSSGESRFLVLKAYPNHPARQQMLEMTNIFLKEFIVYDFWFPTYMKIQEEFGHPAAFTLSVPPYLDGAAVDNPFPTFPPKDAPAPAETEVASAPTNEQPAVPKLNILENFLLMEDVRKRGFRMADRIKGLDVDHSKLFLKELAKLHGLGWVYKQKKGIPSLTEKYPYMEERMFRPEFMDSFKPVFDAIVGAATGMLQETLGVDSPIFQNFTELMKQDTNDYMSWYVNDKGIDLDKVDALLRVKTQFPEGFNKEPWLLACHGDCWVNNFLFRYKDDDNKENSKPKPEEIIMVDFQLFREACPTTDLAYFLFTSTTTATRKAHMDEFLQVYHDSFIQVCETFDTVPLPGFSIDSLKLRFRQTNLFGLMISLPLLFAVLKNPENAEDLDTLEMGDMGDIFAKGMKVEDENLLLKERLTEVATEIYNNGVL